MDGSPFASKTLAFADLDAPPVAPAAAALQRFAFGLGLRGTRFAVNGALRRRFFVQRHKLWEYARGVACLAWAGARRVLDFGGGATPPVLYLASRGADVLSLDVNPGLTAQTNAAAARHRWTLRGSTHDLTRQPAPDHWGRFDAVISFSVLEHIPAAPRRAALERMAALLAPGGVMVLTFDYGADAPQPHALRDPAEVAALAAAARLTTLDGQPFHDTGARFRLDRRHPDRHFTFGSLFLRAPTAGW